MISTKDAISMVTLLTGDSVNFVIPGSDIHETIPHISSNVTQYRKVFICFVVIIFYRFLFAGRV